MKAIELARASQRAYGQCTHSAGDNQAALEVLEDHAILAFRGTEKDFDDILTDMRFMPWRSSRLKTWAHAGFLKSSQALYDAMLSDVMAVAGARTPLHLTGHSLGGAQATLFLCMLRARGLVQVGDVTLTCFGPPPAQYGRGLDKWLKGIDVKLYRNGGDCVTRHPLLGSHVRPLIEIGPIGDSRHRLLDHRINDYIYSLKGLV